MISKSTKKNRRKMAFANENRARLIHEFVDSRCDFWYLGIKQTWRSVQWIEIYGKKMQFADFVTCPVLWVLKTTTTWLGQSISKMNRFKTDTSMELI